MFGRSLLELEAQNSELEKQVEYRVAVVVREKAAAE